MTATVAVARERKKKFDEYVQIAQLPEASRLKKTTDGWWTEIETFIDTRATNARTEAANTAIKNIKRTGRGFRNENNYRTRIRLFVVRGEDVGSRRWDVEGSWPAGMGVVETSTDQRTTSRVRAYGFAA